MTESNMKMEKRVCSVCGKEYEFPKEIGDNVSVIIKKQDLLNMCDKCYLTYVKEQEDAE